MRFAIWTPLPESAPHGGVKVLWILGRELVARGHGVVMWTPGEPQPSCDVLIVPERTAPATSHPRTVRWVLLHGGDRRPGEKVYTFSPAYAPAPELQTPCFDLAEFTPTTEPRYGTAVWVGKGKVGRTPADARFITYDMPRAEVLEILQTSVSLLSFDAFSAVNTEATLFGTPVTLPMIRPENLPEEDDYGFRWLNVDRSSLLGQAREQVARRNLQAIATIDAFVEDLIAWT